MRPSVVAALLGLLAVQAGCTHPRSGMPRPKLGPEVPPSALRDDLPSIHSTINEGVAAPSIRPRAGAALPTPLPLPAGLPDAPPIPTTSRQDRRTDDSLQLASAAAEPPPLVEPEPTPLSFPSAPSALEEAPSAAPPSAPGNEGPLPIEPSPTPPPAPPAPADPVSSAPPPATAAQSDLQITALPMIGSVAAQVGSEYISFSELDREVRDYLRRLDPQQRPSKQELNMLASHILTSLIDRALIVNEARRLLKNPQQRKSFEEAVDKEWRENELPPMLRQNSVSNEYELKVKLAEQGKSLDQMHEAFRQTILAREFLHQKLKDRLRVDLPEMRDYYNAHLSDFDRPAAVSWREVVISFAKHPDRAAARRRAEMLLGRLARGEDFAAVAKAESDGPTASKGGVWETTPGGYAIPAVNSALDSLPARQLSGLLEGPDGYYIVRVDRRRAAGPLSFAEVQNEIRDRIFDEKRQREAAAYIAKLRSSTLITSMFDRSPSAPER